MLDWPVENLPLSSLRFQYIMLLFYPVDYGYVAPTEFYALESLLPSPADLPTCPAPCWPSPPAGRLGQSAVFVIIILAIILTAVSAVSLVSLVSGFFSLVSCGNFLMIEQP